MGIDKFLEGLYKRFFLRDLLSIMFCGSVVLVSIIQNLLTTPNNAALDNFQKDIGQVFDKSQVLVYFLFIGLSYSIGLIINLFRDILIFNLFFNKIIFKSTIYNYYDEMVKFYTYSSEQLYSAVADLRERSAFIMQMVGNFSISLIISAFIINFEGFDSFKKITILVLIGIIGIIISAIKHYELIQLSKAALDFFPKSAEKSSEMNKEIN